MRSLILLVPLFGAALSGALRAQESVSISGQIRPRSEVRNPAPTNTDAFTSMRVRLAISAELENDVRGFIQFQDVRIWGSETNTLTDFSADNLDLHQGYLEAATTSREVRYAARIGRQEVTFGGQRLLGPVGWTQQGRSFDGLHLSASSETVAINVFGAILGDATSQITNDAFLLSGYAQFNRVGPGTLDVYVLHNNVDAPARTSQTTTGVRWWGQRGRITFRGETSLQFGERTGLDVMAFMLGGRVGTTVSDGKGTIVFWFDYLSGDDNPADTDIKVFDTLFATNHKFYGLADVFLNIPAHTGNRGLQDLAVKGTYRPSSRVQLSTELHSFRATKGAGLTSARFGEEIDLTVRYLHTTRLVLSGGLAHVFTGAGLTAIGRLAEDMTWVYLMSDLQF